MTQDSAINNCGMYILGLLPYNLCLHLTAAARLTSHIWLTWYTYSARNSSSEIICFCVQFLEMNNNCGKTAHADTIAVPPYLYSVII